MNRPEFTSDVCVVGGAGRIGLPLSIALADKEFKVVIYDINEPVLKIIDNAELPFQENGALPLLQKTIGKTLSTSAEAKSVSDARYVIVTIGTPVDEHLNPTFTQVKKFFEDLLPHFRNGQTVVLRSTLYPGTTEKINALFQENGLDVNVAFCPERIAEGKAMEELYSLPQIISGCNEKAVSDAGEIFSRLVDKLIPLKPLEAELAKLFTNSWRYIQFAAANQFYMIADSYGADFYRIFDAMKHRYPRAQAFPSPGFAAGPCLFKDTMQLSAFAKNTFFLGHSAMLINEGLVDFMVSKIMRDHDLDKLTVGLMGMAFKANSDDPRESLSYKLRKSLDFHAKNVICSDIHIDDPSFARPEQLIDKSDIIVIGAPHDEYAKLDFKGKPVYDIWNKINTSASQA